MKNHAGQRSVRNVTDRARGRRREIFSLEEKLLFASDWRCAEARNQSGRVSFSARGSTNGTARRLRPVTNREFFLTIPHRLGRYRSAFSLSVRAVLPRCRLNAKTSKVGPRRNRLVRQCSTGEIHQSRVPRQRNQAVLSSLLDGLLELYCRVRDRLNVSRWIPSNGAQFT